MSATHADAAATVKFAILDGISVSGQRIGNVESLVESICASLSKPTLSWALVAADPSHCRSCCYLEAPCDEHKERP